MRTFPLAALAATLVLGACAGYTPEFYSVRSTRSWSSTMNRPDLFEDKSTIGGCQSSRGASQSREVQFDRFGRRIDVSSSTSHNTRSCYMERISE